jgi:tetratricopeptide (TPR) repeat protein
VAAGGIENPIEFVLNNIAGALQHGHLPGACLRCNRSSAQVVHLRVDNDLFLLELPAPICPKCARRSPFGRRSADPYWWWWCPPLLFLALLFGLGAEWTLAVPLLVGSLALFLILFWSRTTPAPLTKAALTSVLQTLLGRFPPYECLFRLFPHSAVVPCTNPHAWDSTKGAEEFARSVVFRRSTFMVSTVDELRRAAIPPVVLQAMLDILRDRIDQILETPARPQQLVLQAAVALLPGRRMEVETQGLATVNPTLDERLRSELRTMCSWPAAYPVVLGAQRIVGRLEDGAPRRFEPIVAWRSRSECAEEAPLGDALLRLFQIESPTEPVPIQPEDCLALCRSLPRNVPLKGFYAYLLLLSGRFDESLAIYDDVVAESPGNADYQLQRIDCLERTGQLERAAAACQRMVAEFPRQTEFQGNLAHLQWRLGQSQVALATINHALEQQEQAKHYYTRAAILASLDRIDPAVSDLNRALFQDANFGPANLLRAKIRLRQQRWEDALADLQQYHRTNGRTVESISLQIHCLAVLGRAKDAEEVYAASVQDAPENMPLRLLRAEFLARSGKLELARQECDTVLDMDRESVPALLTRAAVLLENGQFGDALQDAERVMDRTQEQPLGRSYLIRGLAHTALGEHETAMLDLGTALELDPRDSLTAFHRGRLLFQSGDYQQAIRDLSVALEQHPAWEEARIMRGYALLGAKQFPEALAEFDRTVQDFPSLAEAYNGRAQVRLAMNDKSEALEDLNKAVLLAPENVAYRLNRSRVLVDQHELELAKQDLDQSLTVDPKCVPALFQRAHVQLTLGQYTSARRDFDRLIDMLPDNPTPYIGRSIAWDQVGRPDQADLDRQEAVERAPFASENLELSRLILAAHVAFNNEQYERAVELATEAIDRQPDNRDACRMRAAARWYMEEFVEALQDYRYLIEEDQEVTRHDCSACGQVLAELGEFEEALAQLNRSIDLAKEQGDTVGLAFSLNGRGRALTGLGRLDEAERSFDESLALRPANAWLHFNRGLLYLERQQPEYALACFELALRVQSPKLTPRKRQRAQGFVDKMRQRVARRSRNGG